MVQVLARLAGSRSTRPCLPGLRPLPARSTGDGGEAGHPLDERAADGSGGGGAPHRLSEAAGQQGTTGTQASFLELFEGDHEKCRALERKIAAEMGFDAVVPVSGQTYSRKMDYAVLSTLSGVMICRQVHTDLRLLCLKEVEEPAGKTRSVPPPRAPTSAMCAAGASAPWPAM